MKALGLNSSRKERLLKQQNGLCPVCNGVLNESSFLNSLLHIHHINPIFKGGSTSSIKNMLLLHAWCHRNIDHGQKAFNLERHGINTPSRMKDENSNEKTLG